MTDQDRFYRRANTAMDVAYAAGAWAIAAHLWRNRAPGPSLHPITKRWLVAAGGFVALAAIAVMAGGAAQSTEDYVASTNKPSPVPAIVCLVIAGVCAIMALLSYARTAPGQMQAWLEQQPQPPAPPFLGDEIPGTWRPTPPSAPSAPIATETVVERSVRLVRAPAATTTHQNSTAAPTAPEAPHNVIEAPRKQLTIVTGNGRPSLHTEDHGSYRSTDRRLFDRDLEG